MNQHVNQDLMWKNQNLNLSTENIVKSVSDCKRDDGDVELKDFIIINATTETYACSANGNSFEDKAYHGSDKVDCDRSTSNSSFNQFHSKLTPISKSKEYKQYRDIESDAFIDGIYVQNRSFTNQKPQLFPGNCSSDPSLPVNMLHQFDNTNDVSLSKLRHSSDQPMTDEFLWFYLDPRSNVQGPFLDSQMFQWWSQGIYFQNSLLMKRKCDSDFSTLQDYSKRFNGVPFSRKDIRVPPLTESLSMIQSSQSSSVHPSYSIDQKLYTNGPIAAPIHRTNHQDPNYLLQFMSSVPPSHSSDEIAKLLQKVNIQQRLAPSQLPYEQSLINTSIQNGTDSFVNTTGPSSLSNFVNLRLSNPQLQSSANYGNSPPDLSKTGGHSNITVGSGGGGGGGPGSYVKNERYQSSSWTQAHQPKLTDSVWMSTSDDTILSSNPVWSRSTNHNVSDGSSLLNSIFQDTPHKTNSIPNNSHNKSNPMQETWDNLDPAIIKIVPQIGGDQSNHTFDNKLPKDNISLNQMEQQRLYPTSNNNPPNSRTHSDSVKHPWADLVRKGNSSMNNQKSKSGFNTEHDTATTHSLSPNQRKTSLTSSSSDEYEQTQCDHQSMDREVDSLIKWSTAFLENKAGINNVDIGTLIEMLIYVESPYEVEATMRENVPQFDSISDFVKLFIEKRRPLRQRLFLAETVQAKKTQSKVEVVVAPGPSVVGGAVATIDADDAKWQVKSRSHGASTKKKRNKNNAKN